MKVNVNIKDPRKHDQEVSYALQELKKMMKKDGLMNELRKREHYVAPSRKRRLKHTESIKQRRRDEKKTEWQNHKKDF
jgi:small subunit ribosomal protein S21